MFYTFSIVIDLTNQQCIRIAVITNQSISRTEISTHSDNRIILFKNAILLVAASQM